MAVLYIREYQFAAAFVQGSGSQLPAGLEPGIVDQAITIGAGSNVSAQFNAKTNFVRLHCDEICSVLFGPFSSPPTATTQNARLAANQTEFFGVNPSLGLCVAVIQNV